MSHGYLLVLEPLVYHLNVILSCLYSVCIAMRLADGNASSPAVHLSSRVQNRKLYLAVLVSVLGPLSFGFVLGYSSPAIPDLIASADDRVRLNDDQASWFGVCGFLSHIRPFSSSPNTLLLCAVIHFNIHWATLSFISFTLLILSV